MVLHEYSLFKKKLNKYDKVIGVIYNTNHFLDFDACNNKTKALKTYLTCSTVVVFGGFELLNNNVS